MIRVLTNQTRRLREILGFLQAAGTQNVFVHLPDLTVIEPGDIVLAMGKVAIKALADAKLVPKGRTPTSLRGSVIEYNGAKILVTFDPFAGIADYGTRIKIQIDCNLILRLYRTGTVDPVLGNYQWVEDYSHHYNELKKIATKTGKSVPLVMDLETVGLDEFNEEAWIVSCSITYHVGQSYLIEFKGPVFDPGEDIRCKTIGALLTAPFLRIRGANFKFDLRWLKKKFRLECTNFSFDTTLVGSLLDENRSNSLEVHAHQLTDIGGYDHELNSTHDKGQMHKVLEIDKEGFTVYAGGDTDAGYQVSEVMVDQLSNQPGLAHFYKTILHPSSERFRKMEQTGVLVDLERFAELENDLNKAIYIAQKEAFELMPEVIKMRHKDKLSLSRSAIISDFMFGSSGLGLKPKELTAKTNAPSTAFSHLTQFHDHPIAGEFIKRYKEYNSATKTLSTYVKGFLSHLRSDGRFHASYILSKSDDGGTNSGRLACTGPALQTIPKHSFWAKQLRSCFVAPEGYYFFEVDYSQGELRVIACVANERVMIEKYNADEDLHIVAGCRAAGLNVEDVLPLKGTDDVITNSSGATFNFKQVRQRGKACVTARTRVRTEKGLIPIIEVTQHIKVFDGVELVTHDGVKYMGEKLTLTYEGLEATPEHIVFTDFGAMPFYAAAKYGFKLTSCNRPNNEIPFYFPTLESDPHLQEQWQNEKISTRELIEKAREYGFGDYIPIEKLFNSRSFKLAQTLGYIWKVLRLFSRKNLFSR
jgi:DNA polymerase I-like protein with 3'-5' exonuclease and polymerase domains